MPMGDLIIEDLRLRSGDHEGLQGVSLTVSAGETVALVGPPGSGKTSLVRAIAGLETPYSGSIRIGSNVFFDTAEKVNVPAEKREVGFLFQTYALYPHLTVFENIASGLKLRGLTATEVVAQVNKAIADTGLSHLSARYPRSLSASDRQRVTLARSLAFAPVMILMEEPLRNFKDYERAAESAWLKQVIREVGLPALYVTHDRAEAMAVADRISFLTAGALREIPSASPIQTPPSFLTANTKPEREETREDLVEGQVIDGTIKSITDFGAIVDLGGIDGFLHASDIARPPVDHPSEALNVGQPVRVKVLDFDRDRRHINVGMTQLLDEELTFPDFITVRTLADRLAERPVHVIRTLMKLGRLATINDIIDRDTAQLVAEEMGHRVHRPETVEEFTASDALVRLLYNGLMMHYEIVRASSPKEAIEPPSLEWAQAILPARILEVIASRARRMQLGVLDNKPLARGGTFDHGFVRELSQHVPFRIDQGTEFFEQLHEDLAAYLRVGGSIAGRWGRLVVKNQQIAFELGAPVDRDLTEENIRSLLESRLAAAIDDGLNPAEYDD